MYVFVYHKPALEKSLVTELFVRHDGY